MYSSKVIAILEELNAVEKFSGSHFVTFGGRISRSPPCGVTWLAHELKKSAIAATHVW
jgi:hypothetical protein